MVPIAATVGSTLKKRVRSDTGAQGETPAYQRLAKACCEMSRRDGAIVAWHEVPGTAPPQKSRPVGYGVIRATRNTSGISCARSDRTLRDGSFEGRFPRHFVPGYDRCCPYGTRWQTFGNSI